MTAKVCKKCKFYSISYSSCSLLRETRELWDDACPSYELKDELSGKRYGL